MQTWLKERSIFVPHHMNACNILFASRLRRPKNFSGSKCQDFKCIRTAHSFQTSLLSHPLQMENVWLPMWRSTCMFLNLRSKIWTFPFFPCSLNVGRCCMILKILFFLFAGKICLLSQDGNICGVSPGELFVTLHVPTRLL